MAAAMQRLIFHVSWPPLSEVSGSATETTVTVSLMSNESYKGWRGQCYSYSDEKYPQPSEFFWKWSSVAAGLTAKGCSLYTYCGLNSHRKEPTTLAPVKLGHQ